MEDQSVPFFTGFQAYVQKHRGATIGLVSILIFFYIGLNIAVWKAAKTLPQNDKKIEAEEQVAISVSTPTSIPIKTPTPTPVPTGPGMYSCSSIGSCKLYDPVIQKEKCSLTFADSGCLGKCTDPTVRCKE